MLITDHFEYKSTKEIWVIIYIEMILLPPIFESLVNPTKKFCIVNVKFATLPFCTINVFRYGKSSHMHPLLKDHTYHKELQNIYGKMINKME